MMKKLVIGATTAIIGLALFAAPVFAAQPTEPGCFGRDRAAWIAANSGMEWAAYAKARAGDNGTINQDYKTFCGGDATP